MHAMTSFRYLFISVPAYLTLKEVSIRKTYPLIVISIVYLAIILYSDLPIYLDPILPNGWEIQTSLAFFYTILLFAILSRSYKRVQNRTLSKYITHVGKISWEVFLIQMVLIGSGIIDFVSIRLFGVEYIKLIPRVFVTLVLTLLFAELYKKFLDAVVHIKN